MKKTVPLAFLLLTPALFLNAQDSKDFVLKNITSVHTRVYSVENLLLAPYAKSTKEDGLKDWRDLMTSAAAFVAKSGNSIEVNEQMAFLNSASEQLIKERQGCYHSAVKVALPPAKQEAGLSRIDPASIQFSKINFSYLVQASAALQNTSKKLAKIQEDNQKSLKSFFPISGRKKDALEVINRLALTLQLTMDKFQADLLRLKDASRK